MILRRQLFHVWKIPKSNTPNFKNQLLKSQQEYQELFTQQGRKETKLLKNQLSSDQLQQLEQLADIITNFSPYQSTYFKGLLSQKFQSDYNWPIFTRKGFQIKEAPDSPLEDLPISGYPVQLIKQILLNQSSPQVQSVQEPEIPQKTAFNLVLTGFNADSKVKVIKAVKDLIGLGLKQSKQTVERTANQPVILFKSVSKETHQEIFNNLTELGAIVEFQ